MIKKDILEKTLKTMIVGAPEILKTGFYNVAEKLKLAKEKLSKSDLTIENIEDWYRYY